MNLSKIKIICLDLVDVLLPEVSHYCYLYWRLLTPYYYGKTPKSEHRPKVSILENFTSLA